MTQFFRNIILTIIFISPSFVASAVPAYPGIIKVIQPDGSCLDIKKIGDENGFAIQTSDGFPLTIGNTGYYEYATQEKNRLIPTGVKASNPESRSPEEIDFLSKNTLSSFSFSPLSLKKSLPPFKIKISDFPTIGKQKTLVLLVEFKNMPFTTIEDPYEYYSRLLNEEGFTHRNGANGSAKDYFLKCSNGNFEPEFVVTHPVMLSQDYEYYGTDTTEALDFRVADMVKEACILVDSEIDFSEFDADKDGYVDNVYIFYAGYGEADSPYYDAIWPHSGYLEESWNTELSLDGLKINRYTCSNEIRFDSAPDFMPVGIGTFVHEFGHVLGLADHYDTLNTSGRIGVNEWDTMASASYHNNQNTPPLYSAFERAELGWLDYIDLNPLEASPVHIPVLSETNIAYRISNPDSEKDDYFVLETRKQLGWDQTLPGHGLLVWHIDPDENIWYKNLVNVDGTHQRVDLIEADGIENILTYESDPFPGALNISSFHFMDYDNDLIFSFDNVIENDDDVRIILGGTDLKPDMPEVSIRDIHGTSFIMEWKEIEEVDSYIVNVMDDKGVSLPAYSDVQILNEKMLNVTGLSPLTQYFVEIYSCIGSYKSDICSVSLKTSDLEFFEIVPEKPYIKSITDEEVIIGWNSVENADSYILNVYEIDWNEEFEEIWDFSNDISNLPSEWIISSSKFSQSIFGENSPALKLENNEDYIEFNYTDVKLNFLSFYTQSQLTDNLLLIEAFDSASNDWNIISKIEGNISGEIFQISLDNYSRIRIRFQKKGGYVIIDDIVIYGYKKSYSFIVDDIIEVRNNLPHQEFSLKNLKKDGSYGVLIKAKKQDVMSLSSEMLEFKITDNAEIENVYNDPEIISIFDIWGRKVDSNYKGFVIEKYSDGSSRKIFRR